MERVAADIGLKPLARNGCLPMTARDERGALAAKPDSLSKWRGCVTWIVLSAIEQARSAKVGDWMTAI